MSRHVVELEAKEKAGTLTPEEKLNIEGLRKEIKAIQDAVEMGEKAIPMVEEKEKEARTRLKELKDKIQAKKGEISVFNIQLNRTLAKLEGVENEEKEAKRVEGGGEKKSSNETAVASNATRPVEQTDKDGRRKRGWFDWLNGGEKADTPIETAVSPTYSSRKQSAYEQYKQATQEEELFLSNTGGRA